MIILDLNYKGNINLKISNRDFKFRKLLDVRKYNYLVWNEKNCLKRYINLLSKNMKVTNK